MNLYILSVASCTPWPSCFSSTFCRDIAAKCDPLNTCFARELQWRLNYHSSKSQHWSDLCGILRTFGLAVIRAATLPDLWKSNDGFVPKMMATTYLGSLLLQSFQENLRDVEVIDMSTMQFRKDFDYRWLSHRC